MTSWIDKALDTRALSLEFRPQNPLQTCMALVVKGRSADPWGKLTSHNVRVLGLTERHSRKEESDSSHLPQGTTLFNNLKK